MDTSSILIIGASGQLGQALRDKYTEARSADKETLDITDPDSLDNFDWSKVKIILNAAGFTSVDYAETTEGRVAAWEINSSAVGSLAKICLKYDITMLHISTDYVFNGIQDNHTESELPSPLSVYGETKAAGDIALSILPKHYILRTSWVIGAGKNFVRTMLDVGNKGINPTVVDDQVGRLTFTSELVRAVDHILTKRLPYGTYNITNGGDSLSWADITRIIFEEANFELSVTSVSTEIYYKDKPGMAPRPLKSTLDLTKIESTGFKVTDWRDDLKHYITQEVSK
jgi:dTDP-4-dehydrorhamnose reductase